jgi:hypothetical protein
MSVEWSRSKHAATMPETEAGPTLLRFGHCHLFTNRGELFVDGVPVPLGGRKCARGRFACGLLERRVLVRRPAMIDRNIASDSQKPGGEFREIAAVPVLEGAGSEILGQGFVAQPIAQKVAAAVRARRSGTRTPGWRGSYLPDGLQLPRISATTWHTRSTSPDSMST